MDHSEQTDEALMAAHVAGDERAFAELSRRYADMLYRTLVRRAGNDDDARELVQETFLHVHRGRRDFRTDARFRPWLFAIAFNLLRDYGRKRTRRSESPLELDGVRDPSVEATGTTELERAEQARKVRAAVSQLPDSQREVIELQWFSSLPLTEVAVVLGISHGAAKVRAHRGYRRLEALLASEKVTAAGGSA